MRLGVKPHIFLARLLLAFAVTYALFIPMASAYTQLLAFLTRGALNAGEALSGGTARSVVFMGETEEGRRVIYYGHGKFAQLRSGIDAEWVQANLVLLIPLMLAVPAATYSERLKRLALAIAIAVMLQVLDIMVTVQAFYASFQPAGYGSLSRRLLQFGDAFTQAFDTQLFPVVIWAGIHFRQLLGGDAAAAKPAMQRVQAEKTAPRRQKAKTKR